MDRKLALENLAQAEAAVAEGIRHIGEQQARIARLRGDGHDVAEAERLLRLFCEVQRQHETHRDRLLAEVATMS